VAGFLWTAAYRQNQRGPGIILSGRYDLAEELGISRQGVHDRIRQGTNNLGGYESKLRLVQRFITQKELASGALKLLDENEIDSARDIIRKLTDML